MIATASSFYYGFKIDKDNNTINFTEGAGPELTAFIDVGAYTLTEMCREIAKALNAYGGLEYACSVDRATRIITITASASASLLVTTGTTMGTSPWGLLGFGSDILNATVFAGTYDAGYKYEPQYLLQDYVPTSNYKGSAFSTVNKSASGAVQIQRFGTVQYMECNMRFLTDILQPSDGPIRSDAYGVTNIRDFLSWCIDKGPLEFMPNASTPSVFEAMILESTPDSEDGTTFKLKELYGLGLPGYYETGTLKFRKL